MLLIAASTCLDFNIARQIDRSDRDDIRRRLIWLSVILNLGVLGIFKYLDFFIGSTVDLLEGLGLQANVSSLNLILPVGISFYTFQTLSYSIDVYRGRCEVESNFLRFAAYVALFPQLVAGPIVRASSLLPQLAQEQRFNLQNLLTGMEMVIWGFVLKMVVADNLAQFVDPRFESPENFSGGVLLAATVAFAFQIYGDFSGYSLIAIGLGKMMGLDFGVNFRRPYLASDFSDFWERWHISLSSWLRDYLYISLGGNRKGTYKTYRNLYLTMLLGGLWHGAAWTFVVWGFLHGTYLVLQRTIGAKIGQFIPKNPLRKVLEMSCVFVLVNVTWVFFRAEDLTSAFTILDGILSLKDGFSGLLNNRLLLLQCLGLVGLLMSVELYLEYFAPKRALLLGMNRFDTVLRCSGLALGLWSIALMGVFHGSEFVYFQF